MSGILVERPTNTNFTSSHSTDNLSMSNAPYLQPDYDALIDDCQFEHILSQLEQHWPLREQVARALKQANAAFAAQCTDPDGDIFAATCDDLIKFLDLKITLEYSEQKLVVQVLQVACAMHENAVNNPALTPTQRSSHYLATTSLVPLCRSALEGSVTYDDILYDVFQLTHRAEQAHAKATDALDLSKYLDFDDAKDDPFHESGNGTGQSSAATSATSSPVPTPSKLAKPRGSVHDTAADPRLSPQSAKLRGKALVMLNDHPYKVARLGRRHTAPTLLQTTSSSHSSRMSAGRTSSKAHSRGHGLHALQETEE